MAMPPPTSGSSTVSKQASDEDIAYFDALLKSWPIHSIFARSNFDETIDYDRILPVLRLASRLLARENTLLHFYMLLSNEHAVTKLRGQDQYLELQKPHADVNVRLHASVILEFCLSQMVTFSAKRFDDRRRQAEMASLERVTDRFLSATFEGYCSRIDIDKDILDAVYATRSAPVNSEGHDFISFLPAFTMAQTLVHELAHAALSASRPSIDRRLQHIVMAGCSTSEEGFEVTSAQLGGLFSLEIAQNFEGLEMLDSKFRVLARSEWPTEWYKRTYDSLSPKAFTLDSATARYHVYIVDHGWLGLVFTKQMWHFYNPCFDGPPGFAPFPSPDTFGPFVATSGGKFALVQTERSELEICKSLDRIAKKWLLYKTSKGAVYERIEKVRRPKALRFEQEDPRDYIEYRIYNRHVQLERAIERKCIANRLGFAATAERWAGYVTWLKGALESAVEDRIRHSYNERPEFSDTNLDTDHSGEESAWSEDDRASVTDGGSDSDPE